MNITKEHSDNNCHLPAEGAASSRQGLDGSTDLENAPALPCPPSVIRGAKLHQAQIGIDWLRFTMPFNFVEQVTQKLSDDLGMYFTKPGMWGYRERNQFACGAFVTFTDSHRECCIELTGDTCKQLGDKKVRNILHWAYHHFGRATRIDIKVDFKAKKIGLIKRVHQACHEQELCRCRRWGVIEQYAADGCCTGYSVQLGKRGKNGSGRFVRIYDKGLETGQLPRGEWERWETEFSDDAANQVSLQIVESENWTHTACSVALGAVEFRQSTGSRSFARRPLSQWWDDFLDGLEPVLIKIKRTKARLDSYVAWLRRSVLPSIHTISKQTGQDLAQVWDYFTGSESLAKPLERASPVVWEYLNEFLAGKPALAGITPNSRFGTERSQPRVSSPKVTQAVCVICHKVTQPVNQLVTYGQTGQCKCRDCLIETPDEKSKRDAKKTIGNLKFLVH